MCFRKIEGDTMKKLIEYLFKPYTCEYESNWSSQCYNRLWKILAPICICLMITLPILAINNFIAAVVIVFLILSCLFVGNVIQLLIAERIYKAHCDFLYSRLNGGKIIIDEKNI
jgi:hypothetical protein